MSNTSWEGLRSELLSKVEEAFDDIAATTSSVESAKDLRKGMKEFRQVLDEVHLYSDTRAAAILYRLRGDIESALRCERNAERIISGKS